ncbi:MAG: DHA2 family efflux MFS transporter permease subunit [Rhodospirillaceae bacterium]|nr:DHA2 family efflux MFS transporter permease subunit [Rhodospirillaceae bacterium]
MSDNSAGTPPPRVTLAVWAGFTAMTVGMFLAILDIQIVASSLIDIQFSLNIPADRLSYLQTTYLIAEVIAIALAGWLTRLLGTRLLFVTAMLGFVVASLGCAASTSYPMLYAWRVVQGLFGGAIIPLVFTAAFVLFPPRLQSVATVIGGGFAMLAPTVGPFIGGWITETLSWHWLFLINLAPGVAAAAVVALTIRIDKPNFAWARRLDLAALGLVTVCLGTLELTLKEAPKWGWSAPLSLLLAAVCATTGVGLVVRSLRRPEPLIDLRAFADRTFAVGAWYSFMLGFALFGSVYLLPLFLGLIRGLGPFEIGTVMIVTGAAQLIVAPLATMIEPRVNARAMTGVGFALFAAGLAWNGFATFDWDFAELFGPQVLRGAAVMICLLPVTRLALGQLPADRVADASSLFNLMRNIGGAVGLALVDTVLETRPAHHAERIVAALQAGDRDMAAFVGLPLDKFTPEAIAAADETTRAFVQPLVERAAAVASFNDAWLLIATLVGLSLLALPLMKAPRGSPAPGSRP